MKIIIRLSLVTLVLGVTSWVLIQVPSIQDRVLTAAFTAIGSVTDNLPEEDA